MKNFITILILLVAVGCGKSFTEKDVVGSYERKEDEHTENLVLLENGKVGSYAYEGFVVTWKIIENEVHVVSLEPDAKYVDVFKIEPNGDLTSIAGIINGKREDSPKEHQRTLKKKSNVEKLKAENERLEAELKEKQRKLEAEPSLREARAKNKRLKEDLLKLSVVGSYETKKGEETFKHVFLENGKKEIWRNGRKLFEQEWKIAGKEVHIIDEEDTSVFKIETNGDLTWIAYISHGSGKRIDFPTQHKRYFKKLKE